MSLSGGLSAGLVGRLSAALGGGGAAAAAWNPDDLKAEGTPRMYLPDPSYCFSDAGGTVPCVSGDDIRVAKDYYASGQNLTAGAGAGWKLVQVNGRWRFWAGYGRQMTQSTTGISGSNAMFAALGRPLDPSQTFDSLFDSHPSTGTTLRFFAGEFDWFNRTPSYPLGTISPTAESSFVGRTKLDPGRKMRAWVNGVDLGEATNASTGVFNFTTSRWGSLNNGTVGYLYGVFGAVAVCAGSYSDATAAAFERWLYAQRDTAATLDAWTRNIVCDGNSLTIGFGAWNGGSYPSQLGFRNRTWRTRNFGVSSQTTAQMIADAATEIDPLYTPGAVLCCWEGTNDLYFGASAATALANLKTYGAARKAVGWKVVMLTLLPRSDAGTPGTFETSRQTVNTGIRDAGEIGVSWDAVADVAANTLIGDAGDDTNTAYYPDRVHLNGPGQAIVTGIVETAVSSLL